mmetsp:Transcript_30508/g.65724  ORF Transcript_30508/g.65724 Transcript_30508/m.65724 type:complete len:251 (-) Transcript_30508:406-1158(-)
MYCMLFTASGSLSGRAERGVYASQHAAATDALREDRVFLQVAVACGSSRISACDRLRSRETSRILKRSLIMPIRSGDRAPRRTEQRRMNSARLISPSPSSRSNLCIIFSSSMVTFLAIVFFASSGSPIVITIAAMLAIARPINGTPSADMAPTKPKYHSGLSSGIFQRPPVDSEETAKSSASVKFHLMVTMENSTSTAIHTSHSAMMCTTLQFTSYQANMRWYLEAVLSFSSASAAAYQSCEESIMLCAK